MTRSSRITEARHHNHLNFGRCQISGVVRLSEDAEALDHARRRHRPWYRQRRSAMMHPADRVAVKMQRAIGPMFDRRRLDLTTVVARRNDHWRPAGLRGRAFGVHRCHDGQHKDGTEESSHRFRLTRREQKHEQPPGRGIRSTRRRSMDAGDGG